MTMQTASAEEFTVPHICSSRTLDTGIAMLWAGCQMNMTTLPPQTCRNGTLQRRLSYRHHVSLPREVRLQRELIPKSWPLGTEILYINEKRCCLITCTRFHPSISDCRIFEAWLTGATHTSSLDAWKSAETADGRVTPAVRIFQRIFF